MFFLMCLTFYFPICILTLGLLVFYHNFSPFLTNATISLMKYAWLQTPENEEDEELDELELRRIALASAAEKMLQAEEEEEEEMEEIVKDQTTGSNMGDKNLQKSRTFSGNKPTAPTKDRTGTRSNVRRDQLKILPRSYRTASADSTFQHLHHTTSY